MQRNLSRRSAKATLSETIDHRAKLYSVAAAAAGVTMLALAPPAAAEVVVHGTNLPINPSPSNFTSVPLDINRDGISDFNFSLSSFAYHSFNADLFLIPATGNAVVGNKGPVFAYAAVLARGAKIGPSAHFTSSARGLDMIERSHGEAISSTFYSRKLYGNWSGNPPNRYIGVKFLIDGETHYGWVRFSVTSGPHRPISALITAYAYETVANKRILAGIPEGSASIQAEPKAESLGHPSLGMLAAGADGLALWRRDETLVH